MPQWIEPYNRGLVSTEACYASYRRSYSTYMEGHIATYMQVNCLGDFPLIPHDYGFTMKSECLVPKRCHRNLPDEVSLECNCVKCATRSCPCRGRNVRCCIFCKCQANSHTRLTARFSRSTRVSRYQKGKTNLDFTEARDSEWQ